MKTVVIVASIATIPLFSGFLLLQHNAKHQHQSNKDWWHHSTEMMETCQRIMNQSSMMNPGMMGGWGMMGPEMRGGMGMMMGPRMMNRMWMSDHRHSGTGLTQPLNRQGALERVEKYIESLSNPRLKVGGIKEKVDAFIVDIVTRKEKALVEKVKVTKETGRLTPAYND